MNALFKRLFDLLVVNRSSIKLENSLAQENTNFLKRLNWLFLSKGAKILYMLAIFQYDEILLTTWLDLKTKNSMHRCYLAPQIDRHSFCSKIILTNFSLKSCPKRQKF